jgi:hypothetical protein
MNVEHETQAWHDGYRDIHVDMGVQVYIEMPKMQTSLRYSGVCNYAYHPIRNITMENLTGDTGKRSCQTPYTPMTLTRFLLSWLLEWKTRTPRKAIRAIEHNLQELQVSQDER